MWEGRNRFWLTYRRQTEARSSLPGSLSPSAGGGLYSRVPETLRVLFQDLGAPTWRMPMTSTNPIWLQSTRWWMASSPSSVTFGPWISAMHRTAEKSRINGSKVYDLGEKEWGSIYTANNLYLRDDLFSPSLKMIPRKLFRIPFSCSSDAKTHFNCSSIKLPILWAQSINQSTMQGQNLLVFPPGVILF